MRVSVFFLVVWCLSSAGSWAQAAAVPDQEVYRFGDTVSVSWTTPSEPAEAVYSVFFISPNPNPRVCGSSIPAGRSGSCQFNTADFYHPDEVVPRLQIRFAILPEPGLNSVADASFWIERDVRPSPGALTLPAGTTLRPWDAIRFQLNDLPALLDEYGGLRAELHRVPRRHLGGSTDPDGQYLWSSGYENLFFQPPLSTVQDLGTRTASQPGGPTPQTYVYVPEQDQALALGQYELRLIGSDARIVDRVLISVEMPDMTGILALPDLPGDGAEYPVSAKPSIRLALPPQLAQSPAPLDLIFQLLRMGDGESRQLAMETRPVASCRGWPDCALGSFAADGELFVDQALPDVMMPGRYEARLVYRNPASRSPDMTDFVLVDRVEFVLTGDVEPWRYPPDDRPVIGFGQVGLALDRQAYAVGDTANLALEPPETVELVGLSLWLSLRRRHDFAYGCVAVIPDQITYSAYSPLIGRAEPDFYAPVLGQPYSPLNDPTIPTAVVESADYQEVLNEIAAENRAAIAAEVRAGPPASPSDRRDAWIGWSEDGLAADIVLNLPPGRYELALMRGTMPVSRADRTSTFADAQTLGTVGFEVAAPRIEADARIVEDASNIWAEITLAGTAASDFDLAASVVHGSGGAPGGAPRSVWISPNQVYIGEPGGATVRSRIAMTGSRESDRLWRSDTGGRYDWRHVELRDRWGLVRWQGGQYAWNAPDPDAALPQVLYPPQPAIDAASTMVDYLLPSVWMPTAEQCGPNAPDRAPRLRAVVWIGGDSDTLSDDVYEPVETVFPGYPFFIEAHYDEPPGRERYAIEVSNGRRLEVSRTEDPHVYRSDVLTIQPEGDR